MKIDECLIAQVQLKTTAANVHTVRNVLGVYTGCGSLLDTFKDSAPPEVLATFINTEKRLRAFVLNGVIKI